MRDETRRLLEIDELPAACRTVFMLCAIEEMSTREVSESLEIPETTVRTRLSRAKRLLRKSFASEFDQALPKAFDLDGERGERLMSRVLSQLGYVPPRG